MNNNVVVRILFCSNIGSDSLLRNVVFAHISVRISKKAAVAVDVCPSLVFFSLTQNNGSGLFFKCRFCLYVCSSWDIQTKSPCLYTSPRPGTNQLNVVEGWLQSSRGGQAQAYFQYIFETECQHSGCKLSSIHKITRVACTLFGKLRSLSHKRCAYRQVDFPIFSFNMSILLI